MLRSCDFYYQDGYGVTQETGFEAPVVPGYCAVFNIDLSQVGLLSDDPSTPWVTGYSQ